MAILVIKGKVTLKLKHQLPPSLSKTRRETLVIPWYEILVISVV